AQDACGRLPDWLPNIAGRPAPIGALSRARRILSNALHTRGRGPMTYGEPDRAEPGSSDARAAAKERARELRALHRKQERRRRLIVQLSVLGGALVVIGIVAVTLVSMNQSPARGPLNMASDGIKIGTDLKAVRTTGLSPSSTPVPSETNPVDVVEIRLYVDYLCANCGTFERNNSEQLRTWVSSGAATLEIHPIA